MLIYKFYFHNSCDYIIKFHEIPHYPFSTLFLSQWNCNDPASSMHEVNMAFSQCYLRTTLVFFQMLGFFQSKLILRIHESLPNLCSELMAPKAINNRLSCG